MWIEKTGLDYFGARYMSSPLGRFMSPDPIVITSSRLRDPQQLNAYTYVRNNPLRYNDPTGETLTISGDINQIMKELCEQLGEDCSRIIYDKTKQTITVDITGIDLLKNEGAALLNDLVSSEKQYSLHLGEQIPTLAGFRSVSAPLENLDVNPDSRYSKGKTDSFLPPSGIHSQIGINPFVKRESLTDLRPTTTGDLIFHELAESYSKIDGGMQYSDAHQEAIRRENIFRGQQPYRKDYNPGSGPGDKVIIRR